MTRTQIQLPDDVYARARRVCRSREISLAELARRGLEYMLSVYGADPGTSTEWHPPSPRHLGWRGLSEAALKRQAQLTATETASVRRQKR